MIGQLYTYLYPEQYFNPHSAPDRVAKVVQRARHELQQHGANLTILLKKQSYSLAPTGPIHLTLRRDRERNWQNESSLQQEGRLDRLQKLWPHQPFSSAQAGQALALSHRSAQDLLAEAKAKNLVSVQGHGRAQKYLFKKVA